MLVEKTVNLRYGTQIKAQSRSLQLTSAVRSRIINFQAVKTQLFKHQRQAVCWMIRRENGNELPPFWKQRTAKGSLSVLLLCRNARDSVFPPPCDFATPELNKIFLCRFCCCAENKTCFRPAHVCTCRLGQVVFVKSAARWPSLDCFN